MTVFIKVNALVVGAFLTFIITSSGSALASQIVTVANFGDGSGSIANVQAACNWAAAGDTILFKAGNFTWSSGLVIRKPLILQGADILDGGTRITAFDTLNAPLITFTGFSSSNLVMVTGFKFDLVNYSSSDRCAVTTKEIALANLRVCSNEFYYGYEQLHIEGAKGVVDHNTFHNPMKGISYTAGTAAQANESWANMNAGTGDALFVEDNKFIDDENYKASYSQERIGTFNGGRLVIRYNLFDCSSYTNASTIDPIMTHGNAAAGAMGGYWQIGNGARRGQSVVEIYGNVMNGKRIDFLATLRGSANIVFSNRLVNTFTMVPRIYLREEEYTVSQWNPARTNWPAEDQVHNTFIWDNTFNGKSQTNANIVIGDVAEMIKEGRDFFLHAPSSSGGSEVFTGLNGASGSYPTDGATYPTKGTMIFTPVGPNAYYGYAPFTYPHPLTSGQLSDLPLTMPQLSTPALVKNLRISVPINIWISQTKDDSYFDTTDGLLSQSIDGSTPKVINRIDLLIYNFTNPQTVTVDIRTAPNGGGVSLSNCTRSVTTGGTSEWVQFDMPSVAISNTVYITLASSGKIRWRIAGASGSMYGGINYSVYTGASAVKLQDFCLKVYTK